MSNKKQALIKSTMSFLAMGAVSLPAASQSILEEVIVTAQKREQNIQDVPIAISAYTGGQMKAMGVSESFDIASFTPGVHISGNLAGQNTQFSIRGVTQNDFADIIEAPNAVYVDEGYIAIAQGQTFGVFDIERVEILKGPQGTLFGRNATGGLVHYQTNKPSFDETSGYVDVEVGLFDSDADAVRTTVETAVGGPLSDSVAGRIAVRMNKQDGYLKNLYSGSESISPGAGAGADLGDDDTKAIRMSLAFQPSDKLSIATSLNYAESTVSTGPYQSKPTIAVLDAGGEVINVIDVSPTETRLSIAADGSDAGGNAIDGSYSQETGTLLPGAGIDLSGRPVAGGDFFGYLDPDGDDFTFSSDFAFKDQGFTESSGFNLRLQYSLDNGMELVAISDVKDFEKLLFIDVDGAPVNQIANYAGTDASTFTQEIRLSGETDRARWVVGAYYLNIDNQSDNGLKAPANSIIDMGNTDGEGGGLAAVDIGTKGDLETDSFSIFGQYEYDMTESVTLIAGLRAIEEKKDYQVDIGVYPSFDSFSVNQGDFIPNIFGAGSPYYFAEDASDNLWAGNLQMQWQKTEDMMVYAGIKRGVKAGSYNMPLLGGYLGGGGAAGVPYDEEVLVSYEAGFKMSVNDNTRINGSAYYYDYRDYQTFLFVDVGGNVINRDAENKGIELEIQTTPRDGLDILANISYLDAEVKDLPLRVGSPLAPRDVKPTYTPEVQATAMARYAWPALGGTMSMQGDVSYSDEFYYNARNFDADKFSSYVMANARLSWMSDDGKLSGAFAIRNLTDERAGIQGFDIAILCGCNEVSYRAPRYYSLSLKREF